MNMWQPIETAPKDGSFILLATPKGRIADGFWALTYGVWSWPYVMIEPTHWMPLPELPGARSQPAPSVPDDWMQHAARMAALARKLREPDWHFESIREMQRELYALEEAALAAAPEAKP